MIHKRSVSLMAPKIRWFILTASFLILTFGVYLFGTKVTSFEIPTFACPINPQGWIDGSCYTLSHYKEWVCKKISTGAIFEIILFAGAQLFFIVVLGRVICGYICPFGFIQDVLDRLRQALKIAPLRPNENHYPLIHLVKWEILVIFCVGIFIGINFCAFCPIIVFIPSLAGRTYNINISGWIAVIIIVGSFVKRRFWCNICPLGLIIGLFHKISFFRLEKDCQACTECGACYEACPMGIKSIYTEREKTDITTHDCLMCIECIAKCPENNALALSFCGIKIYRASRRDFFKDQKVPSQKNLDKLL